MVNPQMVMYEEEFNQIQTVVDRLVRDANAKVVFIVDKNGQLIAAAGDIDNVDTTSLASLTGKAPSVRDAAELALAALGEILGAVTGRLSDSALDVSAVVTESPRDDSGLGAGPLG
jgi:hypothetical protein